MILDETPAEFFHGKVTHAIAKQKARLSRDVEFYLVSLLCDFIQPQKIHADLENLNLLDRPLALLLLEAIEMTGSSQLLKFKVLGDISIYIAGFFQESLNRKVVDVDYHSRIGAVAYRSVASLVGSRERDTYEKLADNVAIIIEVMAEVGEINCIKKDKDILSTYDRWTRTNSERLSKALLAVGIDPSKQPNYKM